MTNFIIKKPLITEKSTALGASGKYVFVVSQKATKPEIKKAIRLIYKVDPVSVNIVNLHPKHKKFGAAKGKLSGHKKAVVTIKGGQKIDLQ